MSSPPPPIRSVDDQPRNYDCLVEVKAQVMARDNVLGMWGPLDGGGMSLVGLYQSCCPASDNDISLMQYIIIGHRLLDNRIILKCVVSPNFQYTKVNPTFHHWAVDDNRFGLTFPIFSDASAFEETITRVVENLKSLGPQLMPCSGTNVASQKSSWKVADKELFTVQEADERPSLPEKTRCKQIVPADCSYANSTSYSSGPLSSTADRIVSVSSTDIFFGETKLSDAVLKQRSSSDEVCTSSLGAHGSPTVPYPPRRNARASMLKQSTEPLVCPRRPVRLHDQEQLHADILAQTHCKPQRIMEGAVNVPTCHITPKVVVKPGIDKKRAQTPPPPPSTAPLGISALNETLLDFNDKLRCPDQAYKTFNTFNTHWGRACEVQNRNRDSSSTYIAGSYVHFTKGNVSTCVDKKNEYLYPNFESTSSSSPQSTSVVGSYQDYRNPDKFTTQPPIPLPSKMPNHRLITKPKDSGTKRDLFRADSANFKSKCTYCGEYYLPKNNRRGVCADGPDPFKDCLRKGNCCAQALLYHCADEEDGNYTDLWTCGACDKRSCRQWTIVTLVCLLLPCMWCFLPLRTCHRCGVATGCCGARHQPIMGPIL